MKLNTVFVIAFCFLLTACGSMSGNDSSNAKGINLFTIDQDKQLGEQTAAEIAGDPKQYPILDSAKYHEVYAYIYKIRNTILNSGKVSLKDQFNWPVKIIHNDTILNAFCTPGGHIYVYTGL